jgi:ABC-type sugar transport system ATPase subunit
VRFLSGGNQQEVVLSKGLKPNRTCSFWMSRTRDRSRTKAEFYRIIQAARRRRGIILISSELQELVSICHRVLVLVNGEFTAEFAGMRSTRQTSSWR